ncbi:hypothetical protein D9M70_442800 [compost metagenome]
MHHLAQPLTQRGFHDGVFAGGNNLVPLLQLYKHRMLRPRLIMPGKGDVNALGGLRYVQFDC